MIIVNSTNVSLIASRLIAAKRPLSPFEQRIKNILALRKSSPIFKDWGKKGERLTFSWSKKPSDQSEEDVINNVIKVLKAKGWKFVRTNRIDTLLDDPNGVQFIITPTNTGIALFEYDGKI